MYVYMIHNDKRTQSIQRWKRLWFCVAADINFRTLPILKVFEDITYKIIKMVRTGRQFSTY